MSAFEPEPLPPGKHVVDVLIEERAPTLVASRAWPLWRAVLYPLLKEPLARRMADALVGKSGHEAMQIVSRQLALNLQVSGLDHVPATGKVIIAATHPTGIADGIAMYDALAARRPDLAFFANRDALRVSTRFEEILIPVEWRADRRTRARSRETLVASRIAFDAERCVVLFPSGRLAFMDDNKVLTEQAWMNSVVTLARKYDCPVVPAHIRARNSWLYYWFRNIGPELRDITLFNELLNKQGKPFDIAFGPAIKASALHGDPQTVTDALRAHAVDDVRAGKPWKPVDASPA